MFDVHCKACGRRRLVFPSQVLGVVNDADGIHVTYRCWCHAVGVWDTGRDGSPARSALALAS
jgi:hypothetical protein